MTLPSAPLISAIDVSAWQGVIDWPAVAASGVRVAFVKASEGASGEHSRDARCATNISEACGAGIRVVPYHFFTAADPQEQSTNFLVAVEGAHIGGPGLVTMLDLERSGSPGADLGQRALAWLTIVEEALGARPWVYASPYFAAQSGLAHHIALAGYPLLLASWKRTEPEAVAPWPQWSGWQTGKGPVPGVRGDCDLDLLRCMP